MNPFGPQNAHAAVTNVPSGITQIRYGAYDTWVRDCSSRSSNDGTVLDAAFYNMIVGNLGFLVRESRIGQVERGHMDLVYRAVQKVAAQAFSAGEGIRIDEDGVISLALGQGASEFFTA